MSEQLESLYPNLFTDCNPCAKTTNECNTSCGGFGNGRFAYFILWWIILVVIIWFIIYSLQPSWVMKPCGDDDHHGQHHHHRKCVDQGKAILVSVIIALIIVILFYFVGRSYYRY